MPSHQIKVGNVELVSLSDVIMTRSPLVAFPDTTTEQWKEFPELMVNDEEISHRWGSLAVRSGGKLLIVDTGFQGADSVLLEDMRQKGIDRNEVDIVVFTHIHPDHVGWNLTDGKPNFPKARYLFPQKDWDYWTQPSVMENAEYVANQVVPLKDLNVLELIGENYQLTDELTTVPTPGHTPGHTSIAIASGGERGFILGDVAHSPIQAHHTDWCPAFDIDPDVSRKTRHSVLDMLEAEGILVCAGHFPDPGFGRFVRAESRRLWQGI